MADMSMFPTTKPWLKIITHCVHPVKKRCSRFFIKRRILTLLFVVIVLLYYSKYMFIVLLYPENMGIDKRGVLRGKCTESVSARSLRA